MNLKTDLLAEYDRYWNTHIDRPKIVIMNHNTYKYWIELFDKNIYELLDMPIYINNKLSDCEYIFGIEPYQ